jgi:hypothetical protein
LFAWNGAMAQGQITRLSLYFEKSTKYLVKVKQEIKHTSLDIYDLDA